MLESRAERLDGLRFDACPPLSDRRFKGARHWRAPCPCVHMPRESGVSIVDQLVSWQSRNYAQEPALVVKVFWLRRDASGHEAELIAFRIGEHVPASRRDHVGQSRSQGQKSLELFQMAAVCRA